ncbi:hypothetical protein N431DRAFT_474756 [Stipitochalara longipes BDJ]|nr:hypothetical protein N431DRAFT_474756 [Stipitochalara longipes BDJ]
MQLLILLLTFPLLVLAQSNATTFPQCRMGCPGTFCTPYPTPTPVTTTTILPPPALTLISPAPPATITKIWSSSLSACSYVYWLDISDMWSLTYTTVTTLEPFVTGTYPATITETVISSITYSYVEIYTGGSSWTSIDAYALTSTVIVTVTPRAAAVPTGDVKT